MKHLKTFDEFYEILQKEVKDYLAEVASWDNPELRKKDRDTISCDKDEMYERLPIRRAVRKIYPGRYTTEEINQAIEFCCKKKGQSRKREDFYRCVFDYLNTRSLQDRENNR